MQAVPNPLPAGLPLDITCTLVHGGTVRLQLIDALGNIVATLAEERMEPGSFRYSLHTGNISSGVYFLSLTAGSGERRILPVVIQ
jgi:hypothetical protein